MLHRARTKASFDIVVLCLLLSLSPRSPCGAAQAEGERAVLVSILGVAIGTTLGEVKAKLGPLGEVSGRKTRDGGRKEAWTLAETEFSSVALKTDLRGRVVWVTGLLRTGKEIPFSRLGDLSRAAVSEASQAVWTLESPGGAYRLVGRGRDGKAQVISLLSLGTGAVQ